MTQFVKVKIERIAFGGEGVGPVIDSNPQDLTIHGIKAFVPFSAPADIVWAEVIEAKPNFLRATISEFEVRATCREDPQCRYFTVCGGCELQHITYQEQLLAKKELVEGALSSAGLPATIVNNVATVRGEYPYSYRQRLSLHVDAVGQVGFYQDKTNEVIALDSCSIADQKISNCLPKLKRFGGVLKGKVGSISVEADEAEFVVVAKAANDLLNEDRQKIINEAKAVFPNFILLEKGRERYSHGKKQLLFSIPGADNKAISFPAGSFSQVNWHVNRMLISSVVEEARSLRGAEVLDLYAGAGNFSFPLALADKKVTAVECDPNLVKLGQENICNMGLEKGLKIIKSSVEEFLKNKTGQQYDLLVLDPPRSGIGGIVEKLPAAKKLILISCHLPSFVNDLKSLIRYGWNPKKILPFDMFAQTTYLEIMTVMEK